MITLSLLFMWPIKSKIGIINIYSSKIGKIKNLTYYDFDT